MTTDFYTAGTNY